MNKQIKQTLAAVLLLLVTPFAVNAIETDGQPMSLDTFVDLAGIAIGKNIILSSGLDIQANVYGLDDTDNIIDVLDGIIKANNLNIRTAGDVLYIYPYEEDYKPEYKSFSINVDNPTPNLADSLQNAFNWLDVVHNASCNFVQANPFTVSASCPEFIIDAVSRSASHYVQPMPQYVVRAYVVETTDSTAQELGAQFGYKGSSTGVIWNPQPDLALNLGNASLQINADDFSLFGKYLQRQTTVSMLSQPTLVVDSGNNARIHVGNNVPIVVRSESKESGASIQRIDVGVILDILPVAMPDGRVNLKVLTDVSRVDEVTNNFGAIISTRSISTHLSLELGQTVILGGLIDYDIDHTSQGVPFLRSLPVVGSIFGGEHDSATNREISIMLRVEKA